MGPPGHRGAFRRLLPGEEVDEVAVVVPRRCRHCGQPFSEAPGRRRGRVWRHQVVELLPLAMRVTEYQMVARRCPACGQRTRADLPASRWACSWNCSYYSWWRTGRDEGTEQPARSGLPQRDVVLIAGCKRLPVRRKRDPRHVIGYQTPTEGPQFLPGGDVPQVDRAIRLARGQDAAIRREGQANDMALGAAKAAQFLPGGNLPQVHAISLPGSQEVAIRREGQAPRTVSRLTECAQDLPSGELP